MTKVPKFPFRLAQGYRDFLVGRMPTERERYRELATRGQSPNVMVIGCCDSRVSPEVIFDAHPGELFVVRNIANLVPPFASDGTCHGVFAALEFAVQVLGVHHFVVLGHARCGGIRAYAEHGPPLSPADSIHKWMSLIAPAAELAGAPGGEDYLTRLEQTFPYVAAAAEQGLQLHGAYFDVATGQLSVRDVDGYREIGTEPEERV